MFSLGYGGRFAWPFTLNFFLPVLPASALRLHVARARGAAFAARLYCVLVLIAAAARCLAASTRTYVNAAMFDAHVARPSGGWGIEVALCVIAAAFAILVCFSDPGWAMMERWSPSSRWS